MFKHPVTGQMFKGSEIWPSSTLVVTFSDGLVETYPGIRWLAIPGFSDPVKIDGTTLTVEDQTDTFTLLGVRSFYFRH